jgi:hypothetical protein
MSLLDLYWVSPSLEKQLSPLVSYLQPFSVVAHDAPGHDGVKAHDGVGGAHCQYSVVGQCEMDTPLAQVEHPYAGMGGSA